MRQRVYEIAQELGVSSGRVLSRLAELGEFATSASSTVEAQVAQRLRASFGVPDPTALATGETARQFSWRAGAVPAPVHPDLLQNVGRLKRRFPAAQEHGDALAKLGSQIVYADRCKVTGFEECGLALVRFSGAIEAAFGLTREVMFFYSPHRDLQIRTYKAAKEALIGLPREVTPDLMFVWAPDPRLREKLEDWSAGNFLAVPLLGGGAEVDDEAIAFVKLLRDHIFSRDLFYETTPVQGDRFFGRRRLLQSLRDDVRNQRVTALFGLRKAGKTSVLSQLSEMLSSPQTIMVLRDLESLPSPPTDPIPDLLQELTEDLLIELRSRGLRTIELTDFSAADGPAGFKRAMGAILRKLASRDVRVVVMLDEIEYLTPADRVDIREGSMPNTSQFLGALRSLVQENPNFTFMLSGLTSAIVEGGRLFGRPNPLFSWAKSNFLAPFDRHEADELALSVGQKMGISIEDGALEALFEATGGHAFLYRHLASTVVSSLPVDVFHRRIQRADVLRSLLEWRRLVAGNMQEMVDHVKRNYPDEAYLLDVLKEDPADFTTLADDAPLAVGHLLSLGLIHQTGKAYELTPVLELL